MKTARVFLGLILMLAAHAGAVIRYTVTDLGTLGGSGSDATGISASGQVAGSSQVAIIFVYHAYRYSAGAITDAGTLGGTVSYGNGISPAGIVFGQSLTAGNAATHAFVSDGMTTADLGTLGGGFSAAFAMSAGGVVVGQAATATASHAFSYSYPGGTMGDLGTLAGGTTSAAYGVSSNGVAVGTSNMTGGATHAVSFGFGGVFDLGTLSGGATSAALAINDQNQVVGYSDLAPVGAMTPRRAVLLDNSLTMINLGTLGGTVSEAHAINNSGIIVGYSQTTGDADFHAFIYQGGKLIDLNTLQASGSGWILQYATGINDSGRIVGSGTNPGGDAHGFLLTPFTLPAPTVAISGKKKITTAKAKLAIKGTAKGEVTSITYRVGKKGKTATGTAAWKFTAKLKPGKNKITIIAHGPGGDSAPAKVTVTRS